MLCELQVKKILYVLETPTDQGGESSIARHLTQRNDISLLTRIRSTFGSKTKRNVAIVTELYWLLSEMC